jgi:3-oxoacyl-[acyl-carrier protein] reductase
MRVEGRVAVVTGAGGPMGAAVAARLAEEGASLAICDISGDRLAASADAIARIRGATDSVLSWRCDVRAREDCAAFAAATLERFGRVDILANIVGGIRTETLFEPLLTMSEARWDDTFTLNLKPNFHLVKLFAAGMVEQRYGRIVNVASINFAGERGSADYGAAKAAVASLTRTLAIELAPHVTVNCIAPGAIRTRAMERLSDEDLDLYAAKPLLKRLGEPRDIANAVLFLGSDESAYITGEILSVSGGVWPAL